MRQIEGFTTNQFSILLDFGLRRIRLAVYGARLESVLGAIPHEFESHILRHA